jgi:pyridoxamine 5'-phosphate oxidase
MSLNFQIVDDPMRLASELLDAARRVDRTLLPEPTAFALATATADGRPSARMLLLKGIEPEGFVFYTNHGSRKASELLTNPRAAMCFHWQPLEIQMRIEGPVTPVTDAEADAYFASRPRGSQLGAWASLQSQPIAKPGDLEARLAEVTARFDGKEVTRPPHWSGFRLRPEAMEFWRNMPSRLHVRHRYKRDGDAWTVETLYP